MNELDKGINQREIFSSEGLTPKEDKELAGLLSKLNGESLSTSVFTELARIIPQPVVEVVIFRKKNDKIETLLIPRSIDDIIWPGMFHTPGTALRRSDFEREDNNILNGPFDRIQNGEVNNCFSFTPIFVDRLYRKCDRGPEVAEIYFTELPEGSDKENYTWYPVDQLAQNPKFIQHQLEHVIIAAEQFKLKF